MNCQNSFLALPEGRENKREKEVGLFAIVAFFCTIAASVSLFKTRTFLMHIHNLFIAERLNRRHLNNSS